MEINKKKSKRVAYLKVLMGRDYTCSPNVYCNSHFLFQREPKKKKKTPATAARLGELTRQVWASRMNLQSGAHQNTLHFVHQHRKETV